MTDSNARPPLLATWLLKASTLKDMQQAILGDLQEEYQKHLLTSDERTAKDWYWQQTIRSLPHMAHTTAQQTQILMLFVATFAGYLLINVVDIYVARSAAGAYARAVELDSYLLPRMIYFSLKLGGVILAGFLLSLLTFQRDLSYWLNVKKRLILLGLLLIIPATWLLVFQSQDYSPTYRIIWLAGISPCLLAGAYIGNSWLKKGTD